MFISVEHTTNWVCRHSPRSSLMVFRRQLCHVEIALALPSSFFAGTAGQPEGASKSSSIFASEVIAAPTNSGASTPMGSHPGIKQSNERIEVVPTRGSPTNEILTRSCSPGLRMLAAPKKVRMQSGSSAPNWFTLGEKKEKKTGRGPMDVFVLGKGGAGQEE